MCVSRVPHEHARTHARNTHTQRERERERGLVTNMHTHQILYKHTDQTYMHADQQETRSLRDTQRTNYNSRLRMPLSRRCQRGSPCTPMSLMMVCICLQCTLHTRRRCSLCMMMIMIYQYIFIYIYSYTHTHTHISIHA